MSSSDNDEPKVVEISDDEMECEGVVEVNNEQSDEAKMREFAEITATDEIMAQSILQDVGWDLKRALDVFFGSDAFKETRNEAVMGPSSSAVGNQPVMTAEDLKGFELSLMSWNIDGLDGRSLATRMKAVATIVKKVNPDILFLQEVVDRDLEPIDKLQSLYKIYYSNKGCQYYTAILVSKMFEVEKHDVVHFQNSGMYRTLQIVEGSIGGMKVFLVNTHLESMRDHRAQRMAQFSFCMDRCAEIIANNPGCFLFFGGDLNLRDEEISSIPDGVLDAWVSAGCDTKTKWTWDTYKNDNKQGFNGAKMRFDRIYWHGPFNQVHFSLEGRQRIRSCLCFPSDHWAINATFSAV
uniref:5'-tyrosyl-DNA phosphodiesterase n=1 Tax=Caenorhabditis briggsae TaxID=6238 RepID=TYDP2_CAEBR